MFNNYLSVPELHGTANTGKKKERIQSLDFTKGILVVLMIIYHGMNYLKDSFDPHKYMPFLTPSFIMITGFIITNNYFVKYRFDFNRINKRLVVRSLKLILIFTFLNIGGRIFWSENYYGVHIGLKNFMNEFIPIYVIGISGIVAFEILLPISYVLLISIFLLKLQLKMPYFIGLSAIVFSLACIIMEMNMIANYNLALINFGVIGMTIGLIHLSSINKFLQNKIIFLLLFIIYVLLFFYLPDKVYTQIFLTISALSVIYSIGIRINLQFYLLKQIILIGQYSLISYIFQILFLILFLSFLQKFSITKPDILTLSIITLLSTWIVVYFLDYLCLKNKFINVFYKSVFA